ncbi:MAG: hypothetical protein L6Q60_08685 [Rhodocyclaceae bacterium]|nr:hypothetical protein [Rhodocyclaceae bacterium]
MLRDSLLRFLGTGMVVLPGVLALGTGSLDAVAISLFVLLMLQIATLLYRADDPIGDKVRAEEASKRDDEPR